MERLNNHDQAMKPEKREALRLFESIQEKFIERVRTKITTDYTVEKGFTYHNIKHTEAVVALTKTLNNIGETYGLHDKVDSLGAVLAAWAHDVELVQDPFTVDGKYTRLKNGESEQASVSWLKQQLATLVLEKTLTIEDPNIQREFELVYQRVLEIATESITGTTPKGDLRTISEEEIKNLFVSESAEDDELKTELWRHANETYPVGVAKMLSIEQKVTKMGEVNDASLNVTSADLFMVGSMNEEQFAEAGDGELHESNPFVMEQESQLESLEPSELERIRFAVISHLDFQPGFVEEQWMYAQKQMKRNIEKYSDKFPAEKMNQIIDEYQNVFPNFKAQIKWTLDRCQRLREKYPLLFLDPLGPDNTPEKLQAFSNDNRPKAIEQLRAMINETRAPRSRAA